MKIVFPLEYIIQDYDEDWLTTREVMVRGAAFNHEITLWTDKGAKTHHTAKLTDPTFDVNELKGQAIVVSYKDDEVMFETPLDGVERNDAKINDKWDRKGDWARLGFRIVRKK